MSVGPRRPGRRGRRDRLGEADRVLLLALRAWAPAGRAGMRRIASDERSPLRGSWPGWSLVGPASAPERVTRTRRPTGSGRPGRGPRAAPAGAPGRGARRPGAGPSELVGPRPAGGVAVGAPGGRRGGARADPQPGAGGAPARQRRPASRAAGRSRGPGVGAARSGPSGWSAASPERPTTRRSSSRCPACRPGTAIGSAGTPGRSSWRWPGGIAAEWAGAFAASAGPEFAAIARHDVAVHPGREAAAATAAGPDRAADDRPPPVRLRAVPRPMGVAALALHDRQAGAAADAPGRETLAGHDARRVGGLESGLGPALPERAHLSTAGRDLSGAGAKPVGPWGGRSGRRPKPTR